MNQSRGWAAIKTQVEKLPPGALTGTVSAREKMIRDCGILALFYEQHFARLIRIFSGADTNTQGLSLYPDAVNADLLCGEPVFCSTIYIIFPERGKSTISLLGGAISLIQSAI